ncbi:MAG TPA: histidine kinase dimerization/phosphoacceptor domain-containing protein, partial [Solirubrobacter sp.]|nr:histidine kinase dimerization/phosphoacceptor domain-containing protein [Solirubrobacter sp.]
MIARFTRWYDDHPVAGDAALAAAMLVVFVLPGDLSAPTDTVTDLAFSVALLACLPFRRRAPLPVFAVVGAICLVQIALLDHLVSGDVVALQAVYTVIAYGPAWARAPAAACAAAGALIGSIRWAGDGVGFAQTATTAVASVLLAAALGAWRRERSAALARDRDRQAEAGAARERARIARELHDVVAHSLSVIVVQADGAAAASAQRPDAAAGALRTIADTGRDALAQMRRLLGVL